MEKECLATAGKPEVEGFRDQGFVLPEVESLRVCALKGGARHQFINRE